jgi:hypothetical protein
LDLSELPNSFTAINIILCYITRSIFYKYIYTEVTYMRVNTVTFTYKLRLYYIYNYWIIYVTSEFGQTVPNLMRRATSSILGTSSLHSQVSHYIFHCRNNSGVLLRKLVHVSSTPIGASHSICHPRDVGSNQRVQLRNTCLCFFDNNQWFWLVVSYRHRVTNCAMLMSTNWLAVAAPVCAIDNTAVGISYADHATPSLSAKADNNFAYNRGSLADSATEFSFLFYFILFLVFFFFVCNFVLVWNLVSDIKGRIQTEHIWEKSAEGNIWTEKKWNNRRLKNTA